VIVDIDGNKLLTLNVSGSRVWDVLNTPSTIDELTAALCAKFRVAPDVARQDCQRFLVELVDRGLVTSGD
jgi:hypothetical protein